MSGLDLSSQDSLLMLMGAFNGRKSLKFYIEEHSRERKEVYTTASIRNLLIVIRVLNGPKPTPLRCFWNNSL